MKIQYCSECGAQSTASAIFCKACGSKLQEPGQIAVPGRGRWTLVIVGLAVFALISVVATQAYLQFSNQNRWSEQSSSQLLSSFKKMTRALSGNPSTAAEFYDTYRSTVANAKTLEEVLPFVKLYRSEADLMDETQRQVALQSIKDEEANKINLNVVIAIWDSELGIGAIEVAYVKKEGGEKSHEVLNLAKEDNRWTIVSISQVYRP